MLLFALLASASAATNAAADIQVGAVSLRVPLPAGYCLPKGERITRFQQLAAPDHRNVTLLSLAECNGRSAANRYLLIKTPLSAVDLPLDRAELLRELEAEFGSPDFKTEMEKMPEQVGADKTSSTGVQTEVAGSLLPRGRDDTCAYLGGNMSTIKRGKTQHQAVGVCMTVIGARLIALYAYQDSNDAEAYKRLLPKLKAWALTIRPIHHK